MRLFLKIILGIIVVVALGFTAVMMMTSGEREIARSFLTQLSSSNPDSAREYMHEALAGQFPDGKLNEVMAGTRPYTDISFSKLEASGGVTKLEGTASTADGCSSKISFELVNDQITSFNVEPLCRN